MKFEVKSETINIDMASAAMLWAAITKRFRSGTGFALATLNLDHLVKMSGSKQFLQAYAKHDLIIADGNPIVWLSRLAQKPVDLMPGSELIFPLSKLAEKENIKIALVGSTDTVLEKTAAALLKEIPDLDVAICMAPPFGFDPVGAEATAILKQLHTSDARLCFLALGAPKQEIFAAYGRDITPNVGFVSIGAGLDFIAGDQKRAPLWVRKLALEWLWRMLSNPLRLAPRYIRCILILPGLVKAAVCLRYR